MKMMNAKDWMGDLALYTEDAIELPPNQAAVQGKAAIQGWMRLSRRFPTSKSRVWKSRGKGTWPTIVEPIP